MTIVNVFNGRPLPIQATFQYPREVKLAWNSLFPVRQRGADAATRLAWNSLFPLRQRGADAATRLLAGVRF